MNTQKDKRTASPKTLPTIAFIALGSNLDSPLNQIKAGLNSIADIPQTRLLAVSPWYQSTAIGPGNQPDYINGVISIETDLIAEVLLEKLQKIEKQQGRERLVRWAARTLDLDILLYGEHIIDSERLQIPHPRLAERNFVLYPLSDIAPDLVLPNGTTIGSLLALSSTDGLAKIDTKIDLD